MNFFTGIGNIGSDPELRNTPSGRGVTNFNVAIDRRFYTGQGEDRRLIRETDWIPVVAWGSLAEVCSKYLQKGSKVGIEGTIRPRQYNDANGVRHNTFEVVAAKVHFLDKIRSTEMGDTATTTNGSATMDMEAAMAMSSATPAS